MRDRLFYLTIALKLFVFFSFVAIADSHTGIPETGNIVEQVHSLDSRPIQPPCPDSERTFNPALVDFQGKKINLAEPGGTSPTLVIVASADSKDKVLEFLADFAKPVWESRKSQHIYESLKDHGGQLIYETFHDSMGNAWKNFKHEMGKLDELKVVILADARPLYKDRLREGWRDAEVERAKAIERGIREGTRKGEQIGAETGKQYGLPIIKNWIGLMEEIGREKGRQEGSRRGKDLAQKVADTFIPPYVTYQAEKELLKKSDELLPSVKKILENRLVKDFDKQCSLSILIDEKDFANGVTQANRNQVEWANSYMKGERKINVGEAIKAHQEFLSETNAAADILPHLLKKTEPGIYVALIDANGNTLQSWSNEDIVPRLVADQYLKYSDHMKGIRKIPGCP